MTGVPSPVGHEHELYRPTMLQKSIIYVPIARHTSIEEHELYRHIMLQKSIIYVAIARHTSIEDVQPCIAISLWHTSVLTGTCWYTYTAVLPPAGDCFDVPSPATGDRPGLLNAHNSKRKQLAAIARHPERIPNCTDTCWHVLYVQEGLRCGGGYKPATVPRMLAKHDMGSTRTYGRISRGRKNDSAANGFTAIY